MKSAKRQVFVVLMLMAFSVCWCLAQDSENNTNDKSATRTFTGCLSQGDNANEFVLTAKDGSTWEVKSDTVSLADDVGHEVRATGVVEHNKMHNMKEDTKDAVHDSGINNNTAEHGHMRITRLHSISSSCK